jgi:Icc protein
MFADDHVDSAVISRRSLLRTACAGAALAALPGGAWAREADLAAPVAFRIAHLTDIHVQPELRAGEGFRQCMAVAHELEPRPDLILTGGDLVMDALAHDEVRVKKLFDLYTSICKDSDIPIRQCIGNHDVFGWGSRKVVSPDNASYGKKMVQERLDLPRTTYSFDHKGWHFVMVDDIQPIKGEGYEGGFSDADLAWLETDLKAAGEKPRVLVTHIPVVSVSVFRGTKAESEQPVQLGDALICQNPGPILKVLREYKVNLVLAGHLHDNEVLQYEHTTHVGGGAVSGAWWKGPHRLSPEGFGVIDLRADGTFEHQYHTYGWKAEKPA